MIMSHERGEQNHPIKSNPDKMHNLQMNSTKMHMFHTRCVLASGNRYIKSQLVPVATKSDVISREIDVREGSWENPNNPLPSMENGIFTYMNSCF